ncbi:DNA recombination protein RmuC [Echinicola strongylocentroti]|uniref:DNA recombination protein RmuC n=1 Tax=Echinicola strongylocentroti TaxID=1795355 RepID=A0A2Z4IPD4_9BACT|nr:DNA recombination protein RmuC [Echinicola strongylocentroti]AWW32559.1 DNA recombination protein RmuC [Echinicola strongylocentroti]
MEWMVIALIGVNLLLTILVLIRHSRSRSDQKAIEDRFNVLKEDFRSQMAENRKEMGQHIHQQFQLVMDMMRESSKDQNDTLRDFGKLFRENVREFNELQREKFSEQERRQEKMLLSTEARLDKMRETVDEKLQKTLETRLGQSFEVVSKQLQAVQKGLGEMQSLATGVGDLKRVLTNVKSRGILGEYQLQSILENILAPDQYVSNAVMKKGSAERVEFAVHLPGNNEEPVFLPIDAKFPQEAYHRLLEAYETGEKEQIETAKIGLYRAIKKSAQDISQKYINPPYTTDFAVMFLPMESLYAEVIRDGGLSQQLQRDYKVVVTGPTTLAAMLNSLQMGFKTLAIQKRSSEVWRVLGAVKTEFGKFGNLIEKAQKKLHEANSELDTLVGTRTRVIQRKLRDIEELPENEKGKLLDN